MERTEAFKGAMTAYVDYYTYIRTLIDGLGTEETFAFMTKADLKRGSDVGRKIKEEAEGKEFSISEALHTIIDMAKGIGATDTILEDTDHRGATVTNFGDCPIYEAAKETGMEDSMIEAMCRAGACVFLDSVVKQLNPKLVYRVSEFRSEEHGGCVEEIVFDNFGSYTKTNCQ